MQVQMLDREHLLISMGPPDAGLVREGSGAAQSYCLLVWSIPQVPSSSTLPLRVTRDAALYSNSSRAELCVVCS